MDRRVRKYLEVKAGVPLDDLPVHGVVVRESPALTGERGNRVGVQRIVGSDGVLLTVMPGRVDAVAGTIGQLTPGEIFSPFGRDELCRALGCVDEPPPEYTIYGFSYALTGLDDFRPAMTQHVPVPLRRQDIPPEQLEKHMSERRQPTAEDFTWAFACYRDDPTFHAIDLASYGDACASIAVVMWAEGPVALFGVGTERSCRGQGYGAAVVSAATRWVLEQGEVAVYEAYADNIPSLRIARRLGFSFLQQEMGV